MSIEGRDDRLLLRMPFLAFNIGHVLSIASFLLAGAGAYYGMTFRLDTMDARVARVELAVSVLTTMAIQGARQDEKIINIERRLDRVELEVAGARRNPN